MPKPNVKNLPYMKAPCKDCPYTVDCMAGWLGAARIKELLQVDSFTCHKHKELQCAGHMIMRKEKNSFYALAQQMGLNLKLKGVSRVFKTAADCIKHHGGVMDISAARLVIIGSLWINKKDGRYFRVKSINDRHVRYKDMGRAGMPPLIAQQNTASITSFLSNYTLVRDKKVSITTQQGARSPRNEQYYIDPSLSMKAWAVDFINDLNSRVQAEDEKRELLEVVDCSIFEGAA